MSKTIINDQELIEGCKLSIRLQYWLLSMIGAAGALIAVILICALLHLARFLVA